MLRTGTKLQLFILQCPVKVPERYKKCIQVSSLVKGKSLPTSPSEREREREAERGRERERERERMGNALDA